ncbi:MAG: ribosomal RNA small subunit methyltransferase H [Methylothermaceae bacteria B42]|nr:MAG: ribosomal RNA small subunit methyltransferase H [Methylothermaceae bacteria B42]
MDAMVHQPVLLEEALTGLAIQEAGHYIDCTFGRGGHSRAILQRLGTEGRLLALDKDPQAVGSPQAIALSSDPRFILEQSDFSQLKEIVSQCGWVGKVQGILMDLGVSSPQLDDPQRGFSFLQEGPLDMRMNPNVGASAADWLITVGEKELADVIYRYGEERYSRRIARAIVEQRKKTPLTSTRQLAELIERAVPRKDKFKHPATRTFQAIRIFINRELESLEKGLAQAVEVLAPGGRLAVISFHSLEDRIVKQFFRLESRGRPLPKGLPVPDSETALRLKLLGKKRPDKTEVAANPRARSAILRIAERLC